MFRVRRIIYVRVILSLNISINPDIIGKGANVNNYVVTYYRRQIDE